MLIAMPVWDTVENKRSQLTERVLYNLLENVIRPHDRVIVSDNGSCNQTLDIYNRLSDTFPNFSFILNRKNLGIAGGTNVAWKQAIPGEILCKMDNDCLIHDPGHQWIRMVEEIFARNSDIGIVGLKRKDLDESPDSDIPYYRSVMNFGSHNKGETWIPLEFVGHVMGTCYAFNPEMLPRFGYLMQPGTVYGFDDSLAALRAKALGYKVCFLPQIEIDHLDIPGEKSEDPYSIWKRLQAGEGMQAFNKLRKDILTGNVDPYYDGGF